MQDCEREQKDTLLLVASWDLEIGNSRPPREPRTGLRGIVVFVYVPKRTTIDWIDSHARVATPVSVVFLIGNARKDGELSWTAQRG